MLAGVVSPQYVLQTNLLGTCSILEFAREVQARLLFLSTSRVYPVPAIKSVNLVELPTRFAIASNQDMQGVSTLGIAEDFTLRGHRTLYGTTKLASELLIEEYRQAFSLHAIINRCAVITGPWQMGKADQGVFVHWMAAHYFGTQLSYIGFGGTGKQVRALLHVDDLLRLVDYQLTHFDDLDGETFNVGGGAANSLSLLETTSLCRQITGNKIPIKPVFEERPGDVAVLITDASRVMERTGWKPTVAPNRALEDIYEWISHNEEMLQPVLI